MNNDELNNALVNAITPVMRSIGGVMLAVTILKNNKECEGRLFEMLSSVDATLTKNEIDEQFIQILEEHIMLIKNGMKAEENDQ